MRSLQLMIEVKHTEKMAEDLCIDDYVVYEHTNLDIFSFRIIYLALLNACTTVVIPLLVVIRVIGLNVDISNVGLQVHAL